MRSKTFPWGTAPTLVANTPIKVLALRTSGQNGENLLCVSMRASLSQKMSIEMRHAGLYAHFLSPWIECKCRTSPSN